MLEMLRDQFFTRWADLVTRRPRLILAVSVLLAAASVGVTLTSLRFQSNRNDLISPRLEWNQRFIHWVEEFAGHADLVVVVDTQRPDGTRDAASIQAAKNLIDDLAPKLQALPTIKDVLWGYDPALAHPRTMRLLPMEQFDQRLKDIYDARFLLKSPTPAALAKTMVSEMQRSAQAEENPDEKKYLRDIESLADLIHAFTFRVSHPVSEPMNMMQLLSAGEGLTGWEYLQTDNGRLMFIRVTPDTDNDALTPYDATIASVRQLMQQAKLTHPDVDFGLTGIEVIESDETRSFTYDATISSILAAVLIALLLVTALHGVRVPLMLMATLAIGIAWSFGFTTLAVGHLQVISVVFTAILLGLGVGFGIHLVTRYQRVRHRYPDTDEGFTAAIEDTFRTMGPGVVTGAVTTAAAFCTTLLTDFDGVAEMGLIAGAGVMLCMVAMFCVLPVLLRFFKDRHRDVKVVGERSWTNLFNERWALPFGRHPKVTLILAGVLTAAAAVEVTRDMHFDYDLMALMPKGVDSVEWGQRVITDGGQSVYFGVSIVDNMDQARERAAEFLKLPAVEAVGGIGQIIPTNREAKLAALAKLDARMTPYLKDEADSQAVNASLTPADRLQLVAQFRVMQMMLTAATTQAPATLKPALNQVGAAMTAFVTQVDRLTPAERDARLAKLFEDYAAFRTQTAEQIRQVFDPTPIGVSDLPPGLLSGWIAPGSKGGTQYVLEVYPKTSADVNGPLDPRFLKPFIQQMRSVDPAVTGVVVQVYESGELIRRSYVEAGVLALIVVLVLVWIDFRSIRDALLSLAPVAVGFVITFGVMFLVGMAVNAANIIVLPLMFGIGVDAGVHMIHRWRMNPDARPLGLTSGTGKAISLTSYTAMIGFGSMMIAKHRGVASLGFVLTLGLGMTLLACWTVMPALLELRTRRTRSASSD